MVQSIINTFKVHIKRFLLMWLIVLGCIVAFSLILMINSGDESTYVTFGSYVGSFVLGMVNVLMGFSYFSTNYDDALKMGETRTNYLVSMSVFTFITTFVSFLAMNLIAAAEDALYQKLYPTISLDPDFPHFKLSVITCVLFALVLLAVSMLVGFVVNKFGRYGFFTVYILGCFSPTIVVAMADECPEFSQFVVSLFFFDVWYKPVILAVVVLSVIGVLFTVLKRHSVK